MTTNPAAGPDQAALLQAGVGHEAIFATALDTGGPDWAAAGMYTAAGPAAAAEHKEV